MANHPSAEKRNRQRIVRTERNRAAKSAVRTKLKAARAAIAADGTTAAAPVLTAIKALDRAAAKGVIHSKTASRKKARLARAIHKATLAAKLSLEAEGARHPACSACWPRSASNALPWADADSSLNESFVRSALAGRFALVSRDEPCAAVGVHCFALMR